MPKVGECGVNVAALEKVQHRRAAACDNAVFWPLKQPCVCEQFETYDDRACMFRGCTMVLQILRCGLFVRDSRVALVEAEPWALAMFGRSKSMQAVGGSGYQTHSELVG